MRRITALLTVVILFGCGPSTQRPPDLKGRLGLVKDIAETSKRDSALVDLAEDAGKAGDGEVAKSAVSAITENSLRDATAADVAIKLSGAGQTTAAVEVAKLIAENSLREKTLARIADG